MSALKDFNFKIYAVIVLDGVDGPAKAIEDNSELRSPEGVDLMRFIHFPGH